MLFGLFLKQLFGSAGLPRSVKSQGKNEIFFKVREKSVNFAFGQGNLELCSKSGKSQEIYIILDIMSTKSQEQRKEIENEKNILNV